MDDLVLVHPPSVFDFRARPGDRGPIAKVIPSTEQFDMYPLGLTSIAAYLERNGYRVRILNLGARMVADASYDAVAALRRRRARVFGIDLHWLPHAQGALEVARLVRRLHPDARILLGGLSATYYHEALARDAAVDFVLRGDSTEEPCRQLLAALREGRPLDGVANLTWRRPDGSVAVNPLTARPVNLDGVDLPAYRHMVRSSLTPGRRADALPYAGWWRRPLTVLLTARGCTLDCAICGGSRSAYAAICGRPRPAFRSPERLVADLRDIRTFSRSPVFVVHDPRMGGPTRARRLFELLARERIPNELVFELFWPADGELFGLIAGAVPRWSLQLSVDSQDPAVRARNGKFAVSNEAVEATIQAAFDHGARTVDVFFSVGLPGQTPASALGIADWAERLLERFAPEHRIRTFVAPIAPFLDPGSRAYEDPSLGFRPLAHSVEDHVAALLEPSWARTLTYETDAMTRAELVEATYAVTTRLNDLNRRFGLPAPTGLHGKDEMNWPGREGIRPTARLAWLIATGLLEGAARALARAAGRYDRHVVRA